MSEKNLRMLYVLYPDIKTARTAVKRLIRNQLIVCGNIIQAVESMFVWKGKCETSKECIVLIKTNVMKLKYVKKDLIANHPYETPCVIEIDLKGVNRSYALYLAENLKHTAAKTK